MSTFVTKVATKMATKVLASDAFNAAGAIASLPVFGAAYGTLAGTAVGVIHAGGASLNGESAMDCARAATDYMIVGAIIGAKIGALPVTIPASLVADGYRALVEQQKTNASDKTPEM